MLSGQKQTIKKPNGLVKVVPIVRDVVEIDESYVKGTVLELNSKQTKIGYITIPKFYRDFNDRAGRNVTDDTRKEIERLNKDGVSGLIVDLRNNGGGALEDTALWKGRDGRRQGRCSRGHLGQHSRIAHSCGGGI